MLQELLNGTRSCLKFPFEDLDQLLGSVNLIRPIPQMTTVDFSGLTALAQAAVLY